MQMNTRALANELRLSHWSTIVQDCQASQLTTKAYCEASGIKEHAYYYWQRKLREAAVGSLSSGPVTAAPTGLKTPTNAWAVCVEAASAPSASSITIEISGCRVEVQENFNPNLLAKVCKTLKSLETMVEPC